MKRGDSGLATMIVVVALYIATGVMMFIAPGTNDATGAATLWRIAHRDGSRPSR